MARLFDYIEEFLDQDSKAKEKRRVFARAIFDEKDGHLKSYVRRVMGGGPRVEIRLESLEPLPERDE